MGQVYLAKDTSELERTVAIKLLPAELANDRKGMQRFIREAKAVSGLNHPNVLTIYEFGVEGSTRFIAMEYVDGVTLRDNMQTKRLSLREALDITMQVAAALNVAHEAHVMHRDIKPENIMVRRDGIVKILDFGLAKPMKQDSTTGPVTGTVLHTEPGIVMGTVSYMSPEQSIALRTMDYRTDIWSLGAVLYEMVSGRVPFAGDDLYKQMIAIQEQPHKPLSQLVEHVPERLDTIIDRALSKDPDMRYQTANDMLTDLRNLRRQLDVNTEHDRTAMLDMRTAPTISSERLSTTVRTDSTAQVGATRADSRFASLLSHKRALLLLLGVLAITAAFSSIWYLKHTRTALLTDKDTILLSEFENKTGEEVFDETLQQGLAVQLQQSPFLDIFPNQRVRATLQLMSLSPDERVTRQRALEICQRQGLKAYIAGTIVKFDRNYSITLEALNGQTGDQLALVQVEAEGKDQVLKALSRAAKEMRENLGEELSSLQNFDAKLEVTTSSLEALKDYALGRAEQDKGQSFKAIEFYQKATEKDPNFAIAWLGLALQYFNTGRPALAADGAAKAFELSNRVSADERARITNFYYQIVTGELEKAIAAQEEYVRNYPRASRGPGNLGNLYGFTGQFEKALNATREAQRLNPNTPIWAGNLAESLIQLNRFDEAREVCRQALAQKLDSTSIRERLYTVGFVIGDAQAMQEQVGWASGKTDEYRAVYWQTQTASFGGEWHKSEEYLRHATELALRAEAKEVVAAYASAQALRAAWLGQFTQANAMAEAALKFERTKVSLARAGLALALTGDAAKAQPLIQELEQKHPNDTLVTQLWLPEIKAALELNKGNAHGALDLLEPARRYEAADEFRPQSLRAMAYLKLGQGAQAIAEAQKILNHRGEGPFSLLWPLAHLTVARASAAQGDVTQARKSYEEFFSLWKTADNDLPVLIEAKKEYEKVK
jgi:serine/threonine protein kinase/tetratricopeptide (TPR) repeat protein